MSRDGTLGEQRETGTKDPIQLIEKTLKSKFEQAFRLVMLRYLSGVIPQVVVTEYPKSGGTWLGQLVSSCLDIPFPRNRIPALRRSLMHGHLLPHSYLERAEKVLWLVRDGRDIMISLYHQWLLWNEKNRINPKDVLYHRSNLAFDNFEDVGVNLAAFITYAFEHKPSKLQQFTFYGNWTKFSEAWLQAESRGMSNLVRVRYEDMLQDTAAELRRVVSCGFGIEPDMGRLTQIVEQWSFETQAQRRKGEEKKGSFLRKGVAGDWRNYFTQEAAQTFDRFGGDTLIKLGYEKDRVWVTNDPRNN